MTYGEYHVKVKGYNWESSHPTRLCTAYYNAGYSLADAWRYVYAMCKKFEIVYYCVCECGNWDKPICEYDADSSEANKCFNWVMGEY